MTHNLEHFHLFAPANKGISWLSGADCRDVEGPFIFSSAVKGMLFSVYYSGLASGFNMQTGWRKENLLSAVYIWRMVLLFGFGCINGLFFSGDILTIFALTSSVLIITRKWPDRYVLLLAVCLLAQPMDICRILYSYLYPDYSLYEHFSGRLLAQLTETQINGPFSKMIMLNTTYGHLGNFAWNWGIQQIFQSSCILFIWHVFCAEKVIC